MEGDKYICPQCQGNGEVVVGENLVTQDMAIDAGDKSLEGTHHSYVYEECPDCGGTGLTEIAPIIKSNR